MKTSYINIKKKYTFLENNEYINDKQYYGSFLQIRGNRLPSLAPHVAGKEYIDVNHKYIFKSKLASSFIAQYIYIVFRYIRLGSHFLKFSKKLIRLNMIKSQNNMKKIYDNRTKKLIFIKKYRHLILFFRNKYRNKMKKYRKLLWSRFYQVPESFWTNNVKKKVKSFIWKVLNVINVVKRKKIGRKVFSWKYRLFTLNYDRIAKLVYSYIKKKRYPRKQWMLMKKKGKKKNKFENYSWINYLVYSLKTKRKKLHYKYMKSTDVTSNNELFIIDYTKLKTDKELFSKQIKLINNNIGMQLMKFNSNINNNLLNVSSQLMINLSNKRLLHFFAIYFLFLFLNELYKSNLLLNNNKLNSNYLKWFYYILGLFYNNKNINIENKLIRSGIITEIYKFSNLSYVTTFLKLNSILEKLFIDRDLSYNFVINKLLDNNNLLYKNNNNLNLVITKFSGNILFFIRSNKIISISKLVNINEVSNIENVEKIMTTKENFWIRELFYPIIKNYRYNLKDDIDIPISYRKIINLGIKQRRFNFYSIINKFEIKNKMYSFVKNNSYNINNEFNNTFDINIYNNTSFKNKIKNIINDINYKIPVNIFIDRHKYKKISKLIYRKNKKWDVLIKRMKNRLNIKLNESKFIPDYIFNKKDQLIINKDLHNFFVKKKINSNWNLYKKNGLFLFMKNRLKKNKKTKIDKKSYNINKMDNNNIINNAFKENEINSNINIFNISKIEENKLENIYNELLFLKNINSNKKSKDKLKKVILKKYVNLSISSNMYSYNYLTNKKKNDYLISLWEIRKQNKLIKEKKRYEYVSRYIEKKGFINKNYNFISKIYKELLIEYSRRLHSKNKLNEYERSFEKVGPLSFYYDSIQDVSNLKNGKKIPTNLLIVSPFYRNSYSKPYLEVTQLITKVFKYNFFVPFESLYRKNYNLQNNNIDTLDQYKLYLSNKYNK
jgi:hypothetical protein